MLIAVSESCGCDIALLPVTMSREFNECDLLLVTKRFQWGFLALSDSPFEIISTLSFSPSKWFPEHGSMAT